MDRDNNIEKFVDEFLKRKVKLTKLFKEYYKVLSKEIKESIISYERLPGYIELPKGACRDSAIKLTLDNGEWIKVYKLGGIIEWA